MLAHKDKNQPVMLNTHTPTTTQFDFKSENLLKNDFNRSTFATKLSMLLIKELSRKEVSCCLEGNTDERFINNFVKKYTPLFSFNETIEEDFFRIHTLQTLILLKNCRIIYPQNCIYRINTYSPQTLNSLLFKTFWEKCSWSQLFPSMPTIAEHFFANRKVIRSLLLHSKEKFYIDSLAIDYLLETKLNYRNELLFTSFFDFSVIRWLSYFGFIRYNQSETNRISTSLIFPL